MFKRLFCFLKVFFKIIYFIYLCLGTSGRFRIQVGNIMASDPNIFIIRIPKTVCTQQKYTDLSFPRVFFAILGNSVEVFSN